MNIKVGEFQCSQCKSNTYYNCNRWTNKEVYETNSKIIKHWIFFKKNLGKFTICIVSQYCECCECAKNVLLCSFWKTENLLYAIILCVMWIYFAMCYFGLFLWVDLIYYCVYTKKIKVLRTNGKLEAIKAKFEKDIWKEEEGLPESEWNNKLSPICLSCKYIKKTFKGFIKNDSGTSNDLNETDVYINNQTTYEGYIAVLFKTIDLRINQAMLCQKTDK